MSLKQIIIVVVTAVLLAVFWYLVQKTPLGRAQRACEQDRKMAALLGIDVDRTISITFVMGAALAAVAGTMYLMYYGVVVFSDGFMPGVKAFTAAVLGGIGSLPGAVLGGLLIGCIESHLVGLFLDRLQGRRRLLDPRHRADLPAVRHPRPAGSGEGLSPWPQAVTTHRDDRGQRHSRNARRARPLYAGARSSFGLFVLLIGLKTDQNIRNELILVHALGPARHRRRRSPWLAASSMSPSSRP